VLPGVYCLKGTRLTWHGMLMAACLWAEGVVSHRSASLLWGLEGVNDRLIEITTTTRRESVPGVLVHRVGAEEDLRIMRYQGLCVTDPTRTLINLAGVVDDITLQAALDSALRQRRTYPRLLLRCLDETSTQGRKGASLLRALVVERATGGRPTDSPLEIEAEKFLSRNGIHPAERQHWVSNSRGERRRS
jgi:predicted transcriptional regulator of viral defense system